MNNYCEEKSLIKVDNGNYLLKDNLGTITKNIKIVIHIGKNRSQGIFIAVNDNKDFDDYEYHIKRKPRNKRLFYEFMYNDITIKGEIKMKELNKEFEKEYKRQMYRYNKIKNEERLIKTWLKYREPITENEIEEKKILKREREREFYRKKKEKEGKIVRGYLRNE